MRPRDEELLVAALVALVTGVAGGAWFAWWLAARFSGAEPVPSGGPPGIALALKDGSASWPFAATAWAAVLVLVLVIAVSVTVAKLTRRRSVDRAAAKLPRDRSALGRYLTAQGPIIGRLVASGRAGTLRMTTEDQGVVVAGPRTGKTTTVAIPAAVEHAGPLVVTSNKRDICDAIRGPRSATGEVWVFDPQGIAGTKDPAWWWNPLATCRTVDGARRLAAIWAHTSRPPDAKRDAYFDGEGEELLASLLLAAATGGHPISRIYQWLQRPSDPEPVVILDAVPDLKLMADGLRARQDLPDKQRAGVWGTTQKIVSWIADPGIRRWIEPRMGLVEFDPDQFARSCDTIISLSKEGEGSATPLVTALTANVLRAAEMAAIEQPGGRLSTPLLGVLDEAANVCRWKDLPDLYSHYGSRGIVLVSIFQSWAQMSEAFTQGGAEKLWSAANVRVYGGGVSDPTFLRRLSELAGEHDADVWSHSSGRQGYSRSRSTQRRAVLDIATLGALPPGRAVAFLSAARPVLIELVPWWEGPHAEQVKASVENTAGAMT